ncbi:MAG: hypothetical protein IJ521_05420 [Schwartzia sp.]|nr:hypothetical protein [Schwartzia sp. (in: firmicutes)]
MSIYTYYSSALADPDPWDACHYLLEEHPRYHDCVNCVHIRHCEDGLNILVSKGIDELLEENHALQTKLNGEIPPSFRLKYAP